MGVFVSRGIDDGQGHNATLHGRYALPALIEGQQQMRARVPVTSSDPQPIQRADETLSGKCLLLIHYTRHDGAQHIPQPSSKATLLCEITCRRDRAAPYPWPLWSHPRQTLQPGSKEGGVQSERRRTRAFEHIGRIVVALHFAHSADLVAQLGQRAISTGIQ